MDFQGKAYGVTTVGSRGQIVIPAQARADLKIKPGDQLMVFGRHKKFLGLVKSKDVADLIEQLTAKMVQGNKELNKWKKSLRSKT